MGCRRLYLGLVIFEQGVGKCRAGGAAPIGIWLAGRNSATRKERDQSSGVPAPRWRALLALLLYAIERLGKAGKRIAVRGLIALARRCFDGQLRALFHVIDELRLFGRVLHPGIRALRDEIVARTADLGLRIGIILHREAHDDRDFVADVLARPA